MECILYYNDLRELCKRPLQHDDEMTRYTLGGDQLRSGQKELNINCTTQTFNEYLKTIKLDWRPGQLQWVTRMVMSDGIINLTTGSGKTLCMLIVIGYFKAIHNLSTTVFVDRIALKEQWEKAFLPGRIEPPKIQMIQTMVRQGIYSNDPIVVFDECHMMVSLKRHEWLIHQCQFIKRIYGLSATVENHISFLNCHFGSIIVQNEMDKKPKTKVFVHKYNPKSPLVEKTIQRYSFVKKERIKQLDYSHLLQQLVMDTDRTEYIGYLIHYYLQTYSHLHLLVISERLVQLQSLSERFKPVFKTCLVTSKSWKKESLEINNARLVLGISSIVNQAFNVPHLNGLLFACPKKQVIQTIGRIFRKTHEQQPIIIDLIDPHYCFKNQFKSRLQTYKSQIDEIDIVYIEE